MRSLARALLIVGVTLACEPRRPTPAPHAAAPLLPSAQVSPAACNIQHPTPAAVATADVPEDWPYVHPTTVTGEDGMVVTDNTISTRVGVQILQEGGNAADAAVATAFALAVAYPTAGNIGGGGFAVTLFAGNPRTLDFRETAPAGALSSKYISAQGQPNGDSREGVRSAGVPGSVAGLWELYDKLGSKKKTWAALLQPAIDLASRGFPVDEAFRNGIADHRDRMARHPATAKLFLPDGHPPVVGSTWTNLALSRTLKRIAQQGPTEFYRGVTARAITSQIHREGGYITAEDLKAYQARWRAPLEFEYRGSRVITMPPPSAGGVTLAMTCHILEGVSMNQLTPQSPMALHYLFEALRRSFAARNAKLGDPDFVSMPLDELLSPSWAHAQRESIETDRATPSTDISTAGPASGIGPHTTHLSVVDKDGNAVALTTTINWWYGSGITVEEAGFVLNNEMDDFAAAPGTANGFGLVQGEANAIAPGKRMLSSMSPTIVVSTDGTVQMVLGAAGGPTIISTVFQQLSNVLDFGLDPAAAVGLPRYHMQHLPDVVTYEKGALSDSKRQQLVHMGYAFKERDHVADAPLLARSGGLWVGVAEPRRLGALAGAP